MNHINRVIEETNLITLLKNVFALLKSNSGTNYQSLILVLLELATSLLSSMSAGLVSGISQSLLQCAPLD